MSAVARYTRLQVMRAFGATLRACRQAQGVTQDQLADLCDFDRTYPSLLERGLRHPTLLMLLRLSAALKIAPEQLVTETILRLQEP